MPKQKDWLDPEAKFTNPFAQLMGSTSTAPPKAAQQPQAPAPPDAAPERRDKQERPLDLLRSQCSVSLQRKGRAGKEVTLIKSKSWSTQERQEWLAWAKKYFGTGGAVCDEGIILQGDLRDRLQNIMK